MTSAGTFIWCTPHHLVGAIGGDTSILNILALPIKSVSPLSVDGQNVRHGTEQGRPVSVFSLLGQLSVVPASFRSRDFIGRLLVVIGILLVHIGLLGILGFDGFNFTPDCGSATRPGLHSRGVSNLDSTRSSRVRSQLSCLQVREFLQGLSRNILGINWPNPILPSFLRTLQIVPSRLNRSFQSTSTKTSSFSTLTS